MRADTLRSNAISRRDAAAAEMRRWEEFLRALDELEPASENSAPSVAVVAEAAVPVTARLPVRNTRSVTGGLGHKSAETEQLARQIILEHGPQQTIEMHDLLLQHGHDVGGKEPRATLHARLSRADSLEYVRSLGWRLKEQPRQQDETPGLSLPKEPGASDSDPESLSGSQPTSAAVNPDGGGGT